MSACSKLPSSVGRPRDVAVISTTVDTVLVQRTIQIYNYYPQREPTFIFIFAPITGMKNVSNFSTVFLYGSLEDSFIKTLLNAKAREATQKDTITLFKINNVWAKDQNVVILAVSHPEYLEAAMVRCKDTIKKLLEGSYYENLKKGYYEQGIDQPIKTTLAQYGFTVDLQKGWLVDSTFRKERFIFVHTHFPDRSIFFYKERMSGVLSDSFGFAKRNALTKKYYHGDYILKDLTSTENIEFHGMQGMRLKGVWQNDSLVAGGPFLSYFLIESDTLYIIDGILFLPGERKTDYFTAIEVIMNSNEIIKPKHASP